MSYDLKGKTMSKEGDLGCASWENTDFFAFQNMNFAKALVGDPDPAKVVVIEADKDYTDAGRQLFNKWYALCPIFKDGSTDFVNGIGVGVSTNSGFHVDDTKIIDVGGTQKRGILILHGHFNSRKEKFTIANMHGDWTGDYKNDLNTKALTNFVKYMKGYKDKNPSSRFVLIGNMRLKADQIKTLMPDLEKEYHGSLNAPNVGGSVVTMKNSKVAIDHAITDLEVVSQRVLQPTCSEADHFPIRLNVRLPYPVQQEFVF